MVVKPKLALQDGRSAKLDGVTFLVLGVIVVSYVVGALTSSVDTERALPHRY